MANPEKDYFSWENFAELSHLHSHLYFASQLLDKYSWEAEVWNQMKQRRGMILSKLDDRKLNLSVIGEFSVGKSTFINALLHHELLQSSVIQGTTLTSTIIDYDDTYNICANFKTGETRNIKFDNIEHMRDALPAYTTDPEHARKLAVIRISLPSDNLRHGFRIIDTPGTGSLQSWHEDVTRWTLNEFSDLSIVLIDATHPVPQSLVKFLKNTLGDILRDCVFVVTKLDLVPEAEHARSLAYIRQKISNVVGSKDPFVIPYFSLDVLNSCTGSGPFNEAYVAASRQNEIALVEYMGRNRARTVAKRVSKLLGLLFNNLSEQMQKLHDDYQAELDMLNRSKATDFAGFLTAQKVALRQAFGDEVRNLSVEMLMKLATKCGENQNAITDGINKTSTTTELKTYFDYEIPKQCKSLSDEASELLHTYQTRLGERLKAHIDTFRHRFMDEFKKQNVVELDFDASSVMKTLINNDTIGGNFSEVAKFVNNEDQVNSNWIGGGGFAGAFAGQLLIPIPVVGFVVGLLAGCYLGEKFAPNIGKVQAKARGKLARPLNDYYKTLRNSVEATYHDTATAMLDQIDMSIDNYRNLYRQEIEARLAKLNERKKHLDQQLRLIAVDVDSVNMRKDVIISLCTKLSKQPI